MPSRAPAVAVLAAAFLVLGSLAAPDAAAQKASRREGTFGKARPGGPLLKPAELRECIARQDRIRAATEETTAQQAKLQADRAEIDRLAATLKDQAATLDRRSSDAVGAYNEQAQARDRLIDGYEAAVPAFNAKVEALKAEREAFAKGCEGRRYDEDDAAEIRKGS